MAENQNGNAQKPKGDLNGFGLAGMILGIVGLLCLFCCCREFNVIVSVIVSCFGGLLGMGAVALGVVGVTRKNAPKGMAISGLVMGGIGMILAVIMIIFRIIFGTILATTIFGILGPMMEVINDPEFAELINEMSGVEMY